MGFFDTVIDEAQKPAPSTTANASDSDVIIIDDTTAVTPQNVPDTAAELFNPIISSPEKTEVDPIAAVETKTEPEPETPTPSFLGSGKTDSSEVLDTNTALNKAIDEITAFHATLDLRAQSEFDRVKSIKAQIDDLKAQAKTAQETGDAFLVQKARAENTMKVLKEQISV